MLVWYLRSMRLDNIIDRIKLPFRKDKELFSALYDIIGLYPHQIAYYKLALLHKSVSRRNEKGKPLNNERLEFLGDAILDAVVGDIVYSHFEGKREGFLTNTRSKLVQRETLNKLAEETGITRLILSSGQGKSHNSYVSGNAFEALVGALYLDRGYDACMFFMRQRILGSIINIDKVAYKEVNFKSKLIEWSQRNRIHLDFELLEQKTDKTGSPTFRFITKLEGVAGEPGEGYSKKEAQQLAAKETLLRLRREPQFVNEVFDAKTNRTKMEEEPVENVPNVEEDQNFFISDSQPTTPVLDKIEAKTEAPVQQKTDQPQESDEFDLSDIQAVSKEKSREEIIQEAEEAAYQAAHAEL